jgi:hypothetical protein
MQMSVCCFSAYSHREHILSKMKGGMVARGIVTELLSLYGKKCEKMPQVVTGKSEKPRRFKHVKSLPCT